VAFTLENEPPPDTNGATETPKRRGRGRGRPPLEEQPIGADGEPQKVKKPRRKKASPIDTVKFAKQLQGMHVMVALATGIAEMQLSDTESVMLAESLAAVSSEYGVSMSGKLAATLQLFGVAAIIYLPRMSAIDAKIKAKKRNTPVTVEGEKVEQPTG
jgi:hypothetical protein